MNDSSPVFAHGKVKGASEKIAQVVRVLESALSRDMVDRHARCRQEVLDFVQATFADCVGNRRVPDLAKPQVEQRPGGAEVCGYACRVDRFEPVFVNVDKSVLNKLGRR